MSPQVMPLEPADEDAVERQAMPLDPVWPIWPIWPIAHAVHPDRSGQLAVRISGLPARERSS